MVDSIFGSCYTTHMMNERIQKISDSTDAWCNANFPSDWLQRVDEFLPLWNEKFAELIVEDACLALLEWKGEPFPFDESTAVWILKEHFGVK